MIQIICSELEVRAKELENQSVNSIYFGGGTPSLLKRPEMKEIMDIIHQNFELGELQEVTLEANPDDVTMENLGFWKELGIDRLSMGIQSFREEDLKWMNRAHNVEEAKACISLAKEMGFTSFSVDLIYGLPNLSQAEWEQNIQDVIDYEVDHISAYCLTVEEKTVLAKKVAENEIRPSNEDEQATQFQLLVDLLSKSGYEQYEVSNFCKPDKEAIHNTAYWLGTPYVGVGPSAHSFNGSSRRFNIANNQMYMKKFAENEDYFEIEILTKSQQFNEAILTGLRTKWGVSLQKLTEIQNIDNKFISKKNEFISKEWLQEKNSQITLIKDGWLMADFIASELFL